MADRPIKMDYVWIGMAAVWIKMSGRGNIINDE